MGILSVQQAEEIMAHAVQPEEKRPRRRIYYRPVKQEKKPMKFKSLKPNPLVFCKLCRKRVEAISAVEVIGGSEQGHRTFWMCREHL